MRSETLQFGRYLIGTRGPRTSVSARETARLLELADGRSAVAGIGSYEGATSARLAQVIREDGLLFLVDPHAPQLRPEKSLIVSFQLTEETGPVRLVREMLAGEWPEWIVADQVESLTVIERRGDPPSSPMSAERR